MPTIPVFGRRHFKKGLSKLGFEIYTKYGKGSHEIAKHPTRKPNPDRQIRNVTIPHTRSGTYDDPRLRKQCVDEVCAFGFTEDEVMNAIKG